MLIEEDEFRGAILGRVASFAPVGRKIECPTLASTVGIVMLIGATARQEGRALPYPVNITAPMY